MAAAQVLWGGAPPLDSLVCFITIAVQFWNVLQRKIEAPHRDKKNCAQIRALGYQ